MKHVSAIKMSKVDKFIVLALMNLDILRMTHMSNVER